MILYVDGGEYGDEEERYFALVKPGGTDSRPYVWKRERQSRLTIHHSHHYELSDDLKTVTLVDDSWEAESAGVGAPEHVELSEADYRGVKARIEAGEIYD